MDFKHAKNPTRKNVALRTYIPAPKCGVRVRHLYFNWIRYKYLFQESSIKCSYGIIESYFGEKGQASKSKQSLSINLSTTAFFTFILTRRTKDFQSRRTSTTLPRGHVLRGEFSALIRTIFPTASLLSALEQGQIFSRPSFTKNVGMILHLSPPASRQRILLLERVNTAFPNAVESWPIWRGGGGLNIHMIFFCNTASWILLWFHALMDSLSSLSPR